ncbi:type IV secretory pathway VirJ component [Pseudochelatococcus lubricantis]|uniref:Type IV secretory pathway VirJ component n=1 Tax=Pseudochelatococcus lubricantis TaxID=1538102 RepID=A0ABX0V4G4_9HYPH|nr:virulence factor family protein [Pseudochelatococcus lubricantis]NIJ60001.1 type IV secretory pathway VirJ component [Pseudochelatococcus lubricantis]
MKSIVLFRILASLVAAGMLAIGVVLFGSSILSHILPPRLTVSEIDTATFGKVSVTRPEVDVRGLAVLVTDAASASARDDDVQALARAGLITVTLDFDDVRARLAAAPADNECHYVSDDLKDLAREIEKDLGLRRYFYPIIIGRGEGAAFAYVAAAQAPVNTLAGGISVGFQPVIRADRTYCFDTPLTSAGDGLFALPPPRTPLPDAWRVIAPESDRRRIEDFQSALDDARFIPAGDDDAVRSAIVDNALKLGGGGDRGASGLPVSVIEPEGKANALAIIVSGDGGWRDIDREIGEWLAQRGVAVVGLDSLRYFWAKRDPRELAADLGLLFDHYGRAFGVNRYVLAGFSFGADVIPGAWPSMTKAVKDNVALVSLLSLGLTADYEVTLEGFISAGTSSGAPIPPLLAGLPLDRTQCIYGKEDADSGDTSCTAAELGPAQRVPLEGGHHFDGDYAHLAELIWQRLQPAGQGAAAP